MPPSRMAIVLVTLVIVNEMSALSSASAVPLARDYDANQAGFFCVCVCGLCLVVFVDPSTSQRRVGVLGAEFLCFFVLFCGAG